MTLGESDSGKIANALCDAPIFSNTNPRHSLFDCDPVHRPKAANFGPLSPPISRAFAFPMQRKITSDQMTSTALPAGLRCAFVLRSCAGGKGPRGEGTYRSFLNGNCRIGRCLCHWHRWSCRRFCCRLYRWLQRARYLLRRRLLAFRNRLAGRFFR